MWYLGAQNCCALHPAVSVPRQIEHAIFALYDMVAVGVV